MNDTPRTDAELFLSRGMGIVPTLPKEVVRIAFSRTLERELAAVTEQRDRLAEALRVATAYPLTESWYNQAIEALATLKQCD